MRLVQDGSAWPQGQPRFRMIRPAHFFARLRPGAAVAVVDVWRAFPSIPVHRTVWQDLGLSWWGAFFHLRVLPTGGRASPLILQATMAELLRIVREVYKLEVGGDGVVETAVFMDDAVLQADTTANTVVALSLVHQVAAYIGLRLTKIQLSTQVQWLGVGLDTVAMTATLLPKTQAKVIRLLQAYVGADTVGRHDVERLAGLLQYAATLMPVGARMRVRPFYWHLRAWRYVSPRARLPPSARCRTAAAWWERATGKRYPADAITLGLVPRRGAGGGYVGARMPRSCCLVVDAGCTG